MPPQTPQPNQYYAPSPQPPVAPIPAKGKRHFFIWILLIIIFAVASASAVYFWQQNKIDNLKTSLTAANTELTSTKKELALNTTPAPTDMSPQCEESDNLSILLAPVNSEPVSGYQLFVVVCKKNTDIAPRLIAFTVDSEGNRTFAYGASNVEPMCLSRGIVPEADTIALATGLSVCKLF